MKATPLAEIHQKTGAILSPGSLLPEHYGDVRAEYEAIRRGVAVIDLSPAGKLEVSGKNAVQFINGLVTNDVKSLAAGAGLLAAFLNVQGKLVAMSRIYRLDERLLLELDALNHEKLYQNLNRFTMAGDFFLRDLTEQQALVSLQGPRAAELLEALTGESISAQVQYQTHQRQMAQVKLLIATHSRSGELGFDLFIPAEAAPRLWELILEKGQAAGARAVGQAALDIARLEAGIPREGVDVTEANILLEAGYEKAVSYSKGCYLGQEVIARIHWQGQPARQLRGLLVEAETVPPPGTAIYATDGKKAGQMVGTITSSTHSPALDRIIALGYVHRYYLAPGTVFILKQGESELGRAFLQQLPFIGQAQAATNE
jgi:folate-binding protein YgfZ